MLEKLVIAFTQKLDNLKNTFTFKNMSLESVTDFITSLEDEAINIVNQLPKGHKNISSLNRKIKELSFIITCLYELPMEHIVLFNKSLLNVGNMVELVVKYLLIGKLTLSGQNEADFIYNNKRYEIKQFFTRNGFRIELELKDDYYIIVNSLESAYILNQKQMDDFIVECGDWKKVKKDTIEVRPNKTHRQWLKDNTETIDLYESL